MITAKPYQVVALVLVAGMMWMLFPSALLSAQPTSNTPAQSSPCLTANSTPGQSTSPNTAQSANQPLHVGAGPDDAGAPLNCWLTINGRQWQWYKFRYGYNARTDNPPHQANIELTMNNAGCIRFELWTPERLRAAKDDPALGPVGAGTPKFTPADPKSSSSKNQIPTILTWSGSQAGSSTFYVIVKNSTDAACTYHLSISGYSVFYPKTSK